MSTSQIVVRGVDRDLWRQVRYAAVVGGQPAGALLNHILSEWARTLPDKPYLLRLKEAGAA